MCLSFRLLWCWHQSTLHGGSLESVAPTIPPDLRQQCQTEARRHVHRPGPWRLQQGNEGNSSSLPEGYGSPWPSPVPYPQAPVGQLFLLGAESSSQSLPPRSVYRKGQHTRWQCTICCWITLFSLGTRLNRRFGSPRRHVVVFDYLRFPNLITKALCIALPHWSYSRHFHLKVGTVESENLSIVWAQKLSPPSTKEHLEQIRLDGKLHQLGVVCGGSWTSCKEKKNTNASCVVCCLRIFVDSTVW